MCRNSQSRWLVGKRAPSLDQSRFWEVDTLRLWYRCLRTSRSSGGPCSSGSHHSFHALHRNWCWTDTPENTTSAHKVAHSLCAPCRILCWTHTPKKTTSRLQHTNNPQPLCSAHKLVLNQYTWKHHQQSAEHTHNPQPLCSAQELVLNQYTWQHHLQIVAHTHNIW